MPNDKLILTSCYTFRNGMVIAFDQHGQQMPDYQGLYTEVVGKIRRDFPNITVEKREWRHD